MLIEFPFNSNHTASLKISNRDLRFWDMMQWSKDLCRCLRTNVSLLTHCQLVKVEQGTDIPVFLLWKNYKCYYKYVMSLIRAFIFRINLYWLSSMYIILSLIYHFLPFLGSQWNDKRKIFSFTKGWKKCKVFLVSLA